jgi:hypothetical protein
MARRGLFLDIDGGSIAGLANAFGATELQVEAALRSTYGKLAKWLRTQSVRGLSAKLKVPPAILRSRLKTYRLQGGIGGGEAKVWYGLRDIPLIRLKPRETSKGVACAGGREVEGAFIAKLFGRLQVLKRVGKGRVPLKVQYAAIYDDAVVYIEDELIGTAAFDAQFFKFLEHELKWRTRILR